MVLSLGLMVIVGFQSCAAIVGGNLSRDESTAAADAMGFFVVFLFCLSSDFSDLAIWGFVALGLAVMSYSGHSAKQRRRRAPEHQPRVC